MNVKKQFGDSISPPNFFDECKISRCGNVIEVSYQTNVNRQCYVQKIDKDNYVDLRTGETIEVKHASNRSEGQKSLAKSFKRLRDLINANLIDVSNALWITLTYKENMTDTSRLYDDFRKFNMRFQYFCDKNGYGHAEYIVTVEPQGRGAWHCHLIYIWQHESPFIPNKVLADLWGFGFVKVSKLDNVTNVGAYLSAYMTDLSLDQAESTYQKVESDVKIIQGEKVDKKFVKGGRLSMYPPGIQIFRHSRGIKEPVISYDSYFRIKEKLSGVPKSFERQVIIEDDITNYSTSVYTCQYNIPYAQSQELFPSLEEYSALLNEDDES